MKVEVTQVFFDRYNHTLYEVGQVLDWDDQERIIDCTNRGLIKAVKTAPKTTKPRTTTKKAKQV